MDATESQRPKGRDSALSALDGAIERLDLLKEYSDNGPANEAFRSASNLLVTIRECGNEQVYIEVGLTCANVCQVLDRGLKGRQPEQIGRPVLDAIQQLTSGVAEIEKEVIKQGKRSTASRLLHLKGGRGKIAAWGRILNTILQTFNTELLMSNTMVLSDLQRKADDRHQPVASAPLEESPPPPPRACFGRDELVERIVGLAVNLTPIALVGAGGIGKTSVALVVLHHGLIKERFFDNRRFIRCDQFAASRANLLNRLSKALSAGIEHPEDLAPLRPFLSSKEIFLILDNAESILDPQGPNGQEIFEVVEELSRFKNICLCITSRITTIPSDCKRLNIPPLSVGAAHNTFRRICDKDDRLDLIKGILTQLNFHPLSITLLATVAHQNDWNNDQLAREWKRKHTGMLQTGHNKSLAAAIELSLASPMFKGLGTDARELLGIVAFFPQGINENNLDWLFPDIPDGSTIFSKFCNLSLTYWSKGFFTMLAPLRDHLCPKEPTSSPLLRATRDRYFARMSIEFDDNSPLFGESRWIVSEDVNVEHLLDVSTSTDLNSPDVWDACWNFMGHLYWHKRRLTILGPKVEKLPDDHPAKPKCLHNLSRLFESVQNHNEARRLLLHTLKLRREQGVEFLVAQTLRELSDTNRMLFRGEEAIRYANEALGIYQRLGDTLEQADCLTSLAWVLYDRDKFDAAEDAVSQAIDLLPGEGQEILVCQTSRLLGDIYRAKGEKEKAIHHFKAALRVGSPFKWHKELFWNHYSLAEVFYDEDQFDKANDHAAQAKPHTVDCTFHMGRATELQAKIWYQQGRLEEARSEALLAMEAYRKLGLVHDIEECRDLVQDIEQAIDSLSTSEESDSDAYDTPLSSLTLC